MYYFDAILMDIMMPVMDGYEATHEIRNSEKEDAKSIPIIAMTANAFDDDMKKSKTAGMGAHLSKPLAIYHPSSTSCPRKFKMWTSTIHMY